ncbi:MAG: metallophosphoesterase family protein, partial [Bacteroidota bacterium]
PEIAQPIFISGQYDLVCYGHDHQAYLEQAQGNQLLNPGALMGYSPLADAAIAPTFAIFDVLTKQISFFEISQNQVRSFSL